MHGLLLYFTKVIVAVGSANMASLKDLLTYYRFDPDEKKRMEDAFTRCTEKYRHFELDVRARAFKFISAGAANGDNEDPEAAKKKSLEEQSAEARRSAARFLGILEHPEKCLALFDLIYCKLSPESVKPTDLTLTWNGEKWSLIDYIYALTCRGFEPDARLYKLHRHLRSRKGVSLPVCYVLNRRFW